jgi:hypothetical protein
LPIRRRLRCSENAVNHTRKQITKAIVPFINLSPAAAVLNAPEIHGTNAWEKKSMRNRYQKGSLKAVNGKWMFQYYDLQGKKRKVRLGSVKEMTKSEARLKADAILAPINEATTRTSPDMAFDQFVELDFFRGIDVSGRIQRAGQRKIELKGISPNGSKV